MTRYEDRVLYQGDPWVRLDTLPRLLAEGWRRTLREEGVVSVIRTPFQWVMASPVIEIESGGYMGDVALYVPLVQWDEALSALGEESAPPPGEAADAGE